MYQLVKKATFHPANSTRNNESFVRYRQYAVVEEKKGLAILRYYIAQSKVIFDLVLAHNNYPSNVLKHIVALSVNHMIKDVHPYALLYYGNNKDVIRGLRMNLFYQKGKSYQRLVEKNRYVVPDRAFDGEGYIIHQGLFEKMRFGILASKHNGCGWIAAYNLLKIAGKEMSMEETARGLERYALLGEAFGQLVYTLFYWLKKQGLPVHMTHFSKYHCKKQMENSKAGILLYVHRRGSHYVTYENLGNGVFHFYNVIYGHDHLELTLDSFFQRFTILPISNLIWLDENSL